jgi:hypothetical protein
VGTSHFREAAVLPGSNNEARFKRTASNDELIGHGKLLRYFSPWQNREQTAAKPCNKMAAFDWNAAIFRLNETAIAKAFASAKNARREN